MYLNHHISCGLGRVSIKIRKMFLKLSNADDVLQEKKWLKEQIWRNEKDVRNWRHEKCEEEWLRAMKDERTVEVHLWTTSTLVLSPQGVRGSPNGDREAATCSPVMSAPEEVTAKSLSRLAGGNGAGRGGGI
ncbi:hypothetical protein CHARACLAT_015350 [Characodon lateralis]|uniref:Uncharacterized protein n=1 Tax=Characodon lateralis TaxID=208331 RepID=A0ABU7EJW3_9TELE|nr:hypothetical protein [Characodon lateralis]